jgi:hypothetical protein
MNRSNSGALNALHLEDTTNDDRNGVVEDVQEDTVDMGYMGGPPAPARARNRGRRKSQSVEQDLSADLGLAAKRFDPNASGRFEPIVSGRTSRVGRGGQNLVIPDFLSPSSSSPRLSEFGASSNLGGVTSTFDASNSNFNINKSSRNTGNLSRNPSALAIGHDFLNGEPTRKAHKGLDGNRSPPNITGYPDYNFGSSLKQQRRGSHRLSFHAAVDAEPTRTNFNNFRTSHLSIAPRVSTPFASLHSNSVEPGFQSQIPTPFASRSPMSGTRNLEQPATNMTNMGGSMRMRRNQRFASSSGSLGGGIVTEDMPSFAEEEDEDVFTSRPKHGRRATNAIAGDSADIFGDRILFDFEVSSIRET